AEVEPHQRGVLTGRQQTRGEAAGVKGGPEAIARAAEVMTDRCGVEARGDPAEQHLQPWTDYVGDRPPVCRGDLFARRPGSLAQQRLLLPVRTKGHPPRDPIGAQRQRPSPPTPVAASQATELARVAGEAEGQEVSATASERIATSVHGVAWGPNPTHTVLCFPSSDARPCPACTAALGAGSRRKNSSVTGSRCGPAQFPALESSGAWLIMRGLL